MKTSLLQADERMHRVGSSLPNVLRAAPRLSVHLMIVTLLVVALASTAQADDWQMTMTVDNEYNVYFGDQFLTVPTLVGGDPNWPTTDVWSITGVASSAFLYVATASDHSVAQGFIGEFQNLTTATTFVTSDDSTTPWEVFPAGAHLPALNLLDSSIPATVWPSSQQPTTSQVQTAVAYATTNNLWQTPDSAVGYNNGSSPSPWGGRPLIPPNAEWIWHDTGSGPSSPYPAPFSGFNHDEFLVFRIPGVPIPEPASALLALIGCFGSAVMLRYRWG